MRKLLGSLTLSAAVIASAPTEAHKAKHDEAVTAAHGGQAQAAGPYHLELVAKDGELVLYVTDHSDNVIATDGARAKATIQQGYETTRVEVGLQPAGDNMLKGTGVFTIDQDTKIMVFISLPDQDAYAAQFTPLTPKGRRTGGHAQPQRHPKH